MDFTYVVNVVHGHVEAAESLISQNSVSCGQVRMYVCVCMCITHGTVTEYPGLLYKPNVTT